MSDLLVAYRDFTPNWLVILFMGAMLLLSVASWIVVIIFAKSESVSEPPPADMQYQGFRGWMIVVIIGMVSRLFWNVKSALFSIGFACNWTASHRLMDVNSVVYSPLWGPCLLFEGINLEMIVVASVVSFLLMFLKRRTYPLVMIVIFAVTVAYQCIDHALASQLPITHDNLHFIKLLTQQAVPAAIWIPYFLVSKRVRATFRT